MGLLEKAGQMQDSGKKPTTTKTKSTSPKPVKAKPQKRVRKKRAKRDDLDDFEARAKVAKVMPEEYELPKGAARFARSLVDFLVSYGWMVPLLVITGYGSNFNPTPFILIGVPIFLFNVFAMPIWKRRTVGNFASLTTYVTYRGKPPIFLHQTFKALTILYILAGLMFIATAGFGTNSGLNTTNLGIGVAILILPLADIITFFVRHETKQGLWDSMFFAYMVKHKRGDEEEASGFFGRLESSGDWFRDKGWLGSEEDED